MGIIVPLRGKGGDSICEVVGSSEQKLESGKKKDGTA